MLRTAGARPEMFDRRAAGSNLNVICGRVRKNVGLVRTGMLLKEPVIIQLSTAHVSVF